MVHDPEYRIQVTSERSENRRSATEFGVVIPGWGRDAVEASALVFGEVVHVGAPLLIGAPLPTDKIS